MTSRRNFLRGVLSLSLLPLVPTMTFAGIPRIVGDGVHDDSLGLQAMLDGGQFYCDDEGLMAGSGIIRNGVFAIGRGLEIKDGRFLTENAKFLALPDFDGDKMITIYGDDAGKVVAGGLHLIGGSNVNVGLHSIADYLDCSNITIEGMMSCAVYHCPNKHIPNYGRIVRSAANYAELVPHRAAYAIQEAAVRS